MRASENSAVSDAARVALTSRSSAMASGSANIIGVSLAARAQLIPSGRFRLGANKFESPAANNFADSVDRDTDAPRQLSLAMPGAHAKQQFVIFAAAECVR